jgi:hypothetical protein
MLVKDRFDKHADALWLSNNMMRWKEVRFRYEDEISKIMVSDMPC